MARVAPDFRGQIQPDFGADIPGHRDAIRAHLRQILNINDPALSDLKSPPRHSAWSISISHTFDRGGWLAVQSPRQIGFDLEVRARVREAVIKRMCTPDEIEIAPDLALLWSAKEALFKAMARGQPATLSQLKVEHWTTDGPLSRFKSAGGATGVAQASDLHAAAWCLI